MKYLLAVALAVLLPAVASAATVHDYRYDFNGTSAVLASGSDNPLGDVYRAGDGFRMTISAGADRGWTIGSAYTSILDMSFRLSECGTRTGRFDLTLRRDGVDVYSFSRGPFGQSCIHMGGQSIRYEAGTVFDEIVLNYTLLSSTVATSTILSGNPGYWGAVWRSSGAVYAEVPDAPPAVVPAPPAMALMLGGLGLLSLARRRRRA
jgi:hypothetical protein